MLRDLRYLFALPTIRNNTDRQHLSWILVAVIGGLLALPPAAIGQVPGEQTLAFDSNSRISVEGTLTIHDWSCEARIFTGAITLAGDGQQPLAGLQSTSLTIPVEQLECGKDKMNRKLRDAFRADDHPEIRFDTQQITSRSTRSGSGPVSPLVAEGTLSMAGTTHTIEVTLEGEQQSDGCLTFTGQHELDITDYSMDPPTALLGTIRTDEQVVVRFNLLARKK